MYNNNDKLFKGVCILVMKLNTKEQTLIENNISLIEDNKFDELFNQLSYYDRFKMGELLLSAGISFTGSKINRFKHINIANFLNDFRINKKDILIRKGPIDTVTLKVLPNQYAVYLPEEEDHGWLDVSAYPNLTAIYKWVQQGNTYMPVKYGYPKTKRVLIFDV